ncbi:MAG: RluA family pseudouridine synthase [Clostridia bacterium]|nr:RluA family pseudouridine synthase [Clostridia bacterium]
MEADDLIILHEDNHIIVVLKPQNVPCCPDESGDDSLFDAVKRYIKMTYNKPGNVYLGLVHRLDRPTGGVMVFAKTDKAAARLSESMKSGGFSKRYLAVLSSVPTRKQATLENYIKKNPLNNMVYVCTKTDEGAKFASLDYSVVGADAGLALCEVSLHTGRTHQIRVQMASINCPIFGDMRYGGPKAEKGAFALWAYRLGFEHPVTHEAMKFLIEPPTDLKPWNLFASEIDEILRK